MVCCLLLPLAIITTHFLIISSSSSSSSSSSVSLPLRGSSYLRDAGVLIELKRSFVISDDGLSSWDESNLSSVCSWAGIQCDLDRVVSVDISNYNISGTVSSSIAGLDCLRNLSFAGNSFSGVFPVEVSLLKELRYLNISNNGFNGTMEFWDFSEVKRFQVLDVYNNNFTGFLPVGFTNCSELKYLDLGGNFFNGRIPSSYGGFAKLEYLSLAGNDLNGTIPAELGNLTCLKQLYLGYYNVFDGGIPAELGRLINLVHLDLASCGLDGEIPRQLGELRSLDTLFLMTNFLSGMIPRELANLTGLVSLDLSNNGLTGEIPGEFEELKELKLLNLFMNRLHGSIPDFVAELPNLETLGLWQNNFTGVIPQKFGQNAKLQIVDLSTNKLTGLIPTGLCSGNTLRILILLNNFLFGPIPESLGRCTSLTRVRMGENYLNGSIPSGFLYLPEVNLMELQNNYLSGVLAENSNGGGHTTLWPSKLGQLNLSNNCLSGTLPTSIANFSSLQILLLSSNRFSGKIPTEIGELQHVLKLDLSNNQLSGEIPAEINNCSMLNYLDLSQNQLTGEIPADINKIPILNYINVSHNHLSESLPETMGSMRSLTVADFSFNNFSGRVPDSGQFAYFKASSFAGNPLLCGTLLLNPCEFSMVSAAQGHSKGDLKLVLAIGLLVCSLIFAAGAFAKAWDIKRAHRSRKWKLTAFQKLDFSIERVLECLKESNIIGRGGAGIVYHGIMPNGEEIAVKRLMCIDSHNDHGFAAEIQTLGNIRHRNIVRLLAFCTNRESNLLVYEYMKNGSLGEVLHGKKGGTLLGWDLRYKIGMEAAQGLCYLHHDCSPLIVHRDVKSNNILLDSNFEAHVADFGLAKFLHNGTTLESMSAVVGSYGYIAPEYAYTLKVDEKSDVYSFGVVLLELLTGRRPLGDFGDGVDIVQWVKETTKVSSEEQQDVVRVLDARLKKEVVSLEEARQMFFVAMMCLHEQSVERPTMREVVQMLSELPRKKNNNDIFSP